jgi:hypothetical protein
VLATGSSYTKQSPEKMAWAGVSEWQGIIAAYLVGTVDGVDATAKTLTAARRPLRAARGGERRRVTSWGWSAIAAAGSDWHVRD